MSRRFQFNTRRLNRKIGLIGGTIAGIAVGSFVSLAFTLERYGYRREYERWPFVIWVSIAFGIAFLAAGLLEMFLERRRG